MGTSWRVVLVRLVEAAAVVGVAYVLGAIIITIRLATAGLPSGSEMIALFPSQQILATGVGALLSAVILPAAVLFVFVISDWIGGYLTVRIGRLRNLREKRKIAQQRELTVLAVGISLPIIALLVVYFAGGSLLKNSPAPGPLTAIAFVVLLPALFWAVATAARTRSRPFRMRQILVTSRVAGVVAATALVTSLTAAADGPTKFARAIVYRRDGLCTSGPLLARSGDGIYLANGPAHTVQSIDSREVRSIIIDRLQLNVARTQIRQSAC